MAEPAKPDPSPSYLEAVEEITKSYKSLPPRPTIEEVEAAISVINTSNDEEQARINEISSQTAPEGVSPELFSLLQQMRKQMVVFDSYEQRIEALHLVELDKMLQKFDETIQRASKLVSGGSQMENKVSSGEPIREIAYFEEPEANADKGLVRSSSMRATTSTSGGADEKLSLMKVAAIIEKSAKTGARILDLQGKLMDKIEWLPGSLGKLSNVYELNLSENRIMVLPSTISSLKALTKLDLHSNQLINLPECFGDLVNLADLDLHANMLKSLPPSFGNLISLRNLDLSSNRYTHLPEVIGKLTFLRSLNVETNDLEELPYTIGSCSFLVELRLDFNQIKALPEAIGKLGHLEILTLHYNRVRGLPTTMGNLVNLRELDVSFNELESIPESLCFAVNLVKLNVGKNFTDLRALPRSIGNLEKLEELDISDDQIRVLPDSFRFLSRLRVFNADETPLEVPPRQITKLGAQAVVQYMNDLVTKNDIKLRQPKKKKGFGWRICPLFFH